jgi:hypothetical protein
MDTRIREWQLKIELELLLEWYEEECKYNNRINRLDNDEIVELYLIRRRLLLERLKMSE